jgi:hypothetical protein
MRLTNKQYKNLFESINMCEENFGVGFENTNLKPLSSMAGSGNIVGEVLSDQSIPLKKEIIDALEAIYDQAGNIQADRKSGDFGLSIGQIVKSSVPTHLQGDIVGLLSRKLDSEARSQIFTGYSGR